MSAYGSRTKKVVTYGKKKTRIINIHSDFSPSKEKATPPGTPKREPPKTPLRAKDNETPLRPKGNDTPLRPRDNNTPVKSKTPAKAPPKIKDAAPRQHAAASRRAVYRTSPERSPHHVVRKPAPRRVRALRAMDRVEVTIETRTPRPEPRAAAVPEPPAKLNLQPEEEPESVDEVTRQVGDMTLEPAQPAKRRPRGAKATRAKEPEEAEPEVAEPEDAQVGLPPTPPTPEDLGLARLLRLCALPAPIPFEEAFAHPAFAALVSGTEVRKQGEASYSEVFRVGDAVVKIVPLLPGEPAGPDCSEPADVAREVEVTRRMAHVPGGGFINFRGAFVVTGPYPAPLLAEWDAWDAAHGSESVRPLFPEAQSFALIVLDDGGADLEAAAFDSHAWVDMAGVFWQVCDALARAEDWTQFEHRDLHEGQILLRPAPPGTDEPARKPKPGGLNYLRAGGVQATIIDFGLSRLLLEGSVRWAPLPAECYDGVGAQWDVYRAMRSSIESTLPVAYRPPPSSASASGPSARGRRARQPRRTTKVVQYALSSDSDSDGERTPPPAMGGGGEEPWTRFAPGTNVLWLRYLAAYLLKRARKPYGRRSAHPAKEAARARQEAAWGMLADVAAALDPDAGMFESAREVREWGAACGWVH